MHAGVEREQSAGKAGALVACCVVTRGVCGARRVRLGALCVFAPRAACTALTPAVSLTSPSGNYNFTQRSRHTAAHMGPQPTMQLLWTRAPGPRLPMTRPACELAARPLA